MPPNDDRRTVAVEAEVAELFRRFKFALVGYLVLAISVVTALVLVGVQADKIDSNQDRIKRNAEQVAALLADAQYRQCVNTDRIKTDLHLDNLQDCAQLRKDARAAYSNLADAATSNSTTSTSTTKGK